MSKPSESENSTPLTGKELNEALVHAEIRFRRQWKDDFEAALRGQLNDLLVHFENRLESKIQAIVTDKLASSVAAHQAATKAILADREAGRGYWDRFRAALKDEIKAVCYDTLQEYRLLDENGYLVVPPAAAKAGN